MREADEGTWHSYERHLRGEGKAPNTVRTYWYSLSALSDSLPEGTDLLTATHEHIAAWLADVAERHSSATHASYMRNARAFYYAMMRAGYHDGPHPMAGIAQAAPKRKVMPCPADDDVAALIGACQGRDWQDRRDMAIVRVLLEAGTPREFEVSGIPLAALDLRHDKLTIRGKGGKERVIALGAKACKALELWLRVRKDHPLAHAPGTRDLLFFSSRGPLAKGSVRKILRRRCRMAGVGAIRPHDCRRWTYDKWDELDGNHAAAMMLWGWDTPTMPMLYGAQNAGRRAVTHARTMSIGDRI